MSNFLPLLLENILESSSQKSVRVDSFTFCGCLRMSDSLRRSKYSLVGTDPFLLRGQAWDPSAPCGKDLSAPA